jgi:hypothetical protein
LNHSTKSLISRLQGLLYHHQLADLAAKLSFAKQIHWSANQMLHEPVNTSNTSHYQIMTAALNSKDGQHHPALPTACHRKDTVSRQHDSKEWHPSRKHAYDIFSQNPPASTMMAISGKLPNIPVLQIITASISLFEVYILLLSKELGRDRNGRVGYDDLRSAVIQPAASLRLHGYILDDQVGSTDRTARSATKPCQLRGT